MVLNIRIYLISLLIYLNVLLIISVINWMDSYQINKREELGIWEMPHKCKPLFIYFYRQLINLVPLAPIGVQ